MTRKPIKTVLDTLVKIVRETEEIKMSDAAGLLRMDEASLEQLAIPLANRKILEIHYSFSGNKILKKGENFDKTKKEDEKAKVHSHGQKEVMFTTIRRRIHEKNGILPAQIKPLDYDLEEKPLKAQAIMTEESPLKAPVEEISITETITQIGNGKTNEAPVEEIIITETLTEAGNGKTNEAPVEEISVTETITAVEHGKHKDKIIETTITETVTGYEGEHDIKKLKEAFVRIRQDVERLRIKMEQEDFHEKRHLGESERTPQPLLQIDAI